MLDRADSTLAFTDPSLDVCLTNASADQLVWVHPQTCRAAVSHCY